MTTVNEKSYTHGQLRIRMAGLCYDTLHVEAMPFPVDVPDKTPRALSSDFIRKNFRINHF
jgi:hypothetical protein